MKLRAKFGRPVFIERLQFHDGSRADVANRQPNSFAFGILDVGFRSLALLLEFFGSRQAVVAKAAQTGDVDDIRAACDCGIGLLTVTPKMVKSMASDADLQSGRDSSAGPRAEAAK